MMHRWLLSVFAALVLLGGAATPAWADYVGGLDPNGDNYLALRSGPGTNHPMLRRLGPDTILTVFERDGRWLHVELADGTVGWAYDAYVLPGDPPGADEWTDEAEPSPTETAVEPPPSPPDAAAVPAIGGWSTYRNARFGFSLEYPAAAFDKQPEADGSDGAEFLATAGGVHFFVYARDNDFGRTLDEVMAEDLVGVEGDVVTYQRRGADWFVISGIRGDDVYYRKIVLSADGSVITTLEFDYPRASKRTFDPVAAHMADTLSAGITEAPAWPPEPVPPPVPPTVASDAWRAPLTEVLFDGAPTDLFVPHEAHGGVFSTEARYADSALVADVPPGSAWGKVGLLSPDPLVWMDDFHDDAVTRVTFSFDPAATSGFGIALAQPGWGGVAGNDPGWPDVRFYWIRQPDGASAKMELHVDPHGTNDFWSGTAGPEAPTTVTFVLRPGVVAVEVDGRIVAGREWPALRDGIGFRIYAFSHPADANLAVKMKLRRIEVARSYPSVPANSGPAPGVEPLPRETLFSGTPTPAFEPAATAGGDFDSFATYEGGALVVDVPAGHSWAKTGLISAEPVAVLDDRVRETPLRLSLKVDPARTDTFVLAFGGDKVAEMWPGHVAWFVISHRPDEGVYVLQAHQGPYNDRVRRFPEAWFEAHWDGRIDYDLGNDFGCIRIPDGPSLCAQLPFGPGQRLYATILAHAPEEGDPTRLALETVTRGLVTPPGLTADRRAYFLDDAGFDPDAYLHTLGELLP